MSASQAFVVTQAGRRRPIGVTLLALMFLWIGVLGTLAYPLMARLGGADNIRRMLDGLVRSPRWLNFDVWLLASVLYLFYIAYAVIGFGLWKLRNWARFWVFVVFGLLPLMGVGFAWSERHDPWLATATIFWFATIPAWVAFYLMRPGVRSAFGAYSVEQEGRPRRYSAMSRVLIAIAVIASTLGPFIFFLSISIERSMQASAIYQLSLRQALASPCATSLMGGSFAPGRSTSGELSEGAKEGSADLNIPVHGVKGKGTLHVLAKKQNGEWIMDSLILSNNTTQVNLTTPGAPCQP